MEYSSFSSFVHNAQPSPDDRPVTLRGWMTDSSEFTELQGDIDPVLKVPPEAIS